MARSLMLKFVDGSSKECEVTGRNMGGTTTYYKPLWALKKGEVDWASKSSPDHTVIVKELDNDKVVVDVKNNRGNLCGGPYKLYVGNESSYSYMFGEWSYFFRLTLEWGDDKEFR
jgi:hypothetical protein